MQVQPAYVRLAGGRVRVLSVQKERRRSTSGGSRSIPAGEGQQTRDSTPAQPYEKSKEAVRESIDAFLKEQCKRTVAADVEEGEPEAPQASRAAAVLAYVGHIINPDDPEGEPAAPQPEMRPAPPIRTLGRATPRQEEDRDETVVRTFAVAITKDGFEYSFQTVLETSYVVSTVSMGSPAGTPAPSIQKHEEEKQRAIEEAVDRSDGKLDDPALKKESEGVRDDFRSETADTAGLASKGTEAEAEMQRALTTWRTEKLEIKGTRLDPYGRKEQVQLIDRKA